MQQERNANGGGQQVTVIRDLPKNRGRGNAVLVRDATGQHYVASSVVAPYSGFETLVFKADERGEVTDWIEVAGGRGMSREDAIANLGDVLGRSGGDS